MTAATFRRIALKLTEATEGAHHGHPDFRVRGRIFATLWPDGETGVVVLTKEDQERFVRTRPEIFKPVPGGWGRRGSTKVRLKSADAATLREALSAAWKRIVSKAR